jgi:hypothetical protein
MCEMLDVFSNETLGSGEPGYFEKTGFVRASYMPVPRSGSEQIGGPTL